MSTTGDTIRQLRTNRGLTQRQLAEKSGIIETTIRKYELGTQNPKIENLSKIADALGVSTASLMPEHGEELRSELLWFDDLEQKLKFVGCSVGADLDDADAWIECPDGGILNMTQEELKELNYSIDEFIRFKLSELKKTHRFQVRKDK